MSTHTGDPVPSPDPRSLSLGSLVPKLGIEFLETTPERVVARMPVAGNTQPYGLLHGGATAALCETLGSIGTAIAAGPGRVVMGIHLSVNHVRSATQGWVTATGVPEHIGQSIAVWSLDVQDEGGRRVAVGRLTVAIRDAPTT